jgi:zinc/manganese transport system substrate-binding protein/zinc transport system substrate-binding protein/manganese/iron transport system substrate-binding protein
VSTRLRYCCLIIAASLSQLVDVPLVPAFGASPLQVVVTLPVLKDWAQQIGGPHVIVTSLMTGYESEHTYSPKPSDLTAVRRARVLIQVGAGLEVWVSTLVKNAGNSQLMTITASDGIELIDDQDDAPGQAAAGTRTHAHVHPQGNPHVWLDPQGAATMVRRIAEAFIKADPVHRAHYESQTAAYLSQLDQLSDGLRRKLQAVPDRRLIVHHPAWPYFARYFGLVIMGTLVTQPGAEPSARRIQAVIDTIKQGGIRVIVSEAQLNQKLPQMLARETGTRVVRLTTLPGALPGTETYLDMLRYNVLQLAEALETPSTRTSQP